MCLFDQCIDHGLQEAASSVVDLINEAMKNRSVRRPGAGDGGVENWNSGNLKFWWQQSHEPFQVFRFPGFQFFGGWCLR